MCLTLLSWYLGYVPPRCSSACLTLPLLAVIILREKAIMQGGFDRVLYVFHDSPFLELPS